MQAKNGGRETSAVSATPEVAMQMSEEYGKEGPIRGIFLAEFHHIAGPKIMHQHPEGCISKEVLMDLNKSGHCTVTITLGGGEGERRPSQLMRHNTTDGTTPPQRRLSLYSDQRPSEASYRGYRKSSVSEAKSRRRSSDSTTTSVLHLKVVVLCGVVFCKILVPHNTTPHLTTPHYTPSPTQKPYTTPHTTTLLPPLHHTTPHHHKTPHNTTTHLTPPGLPQVVRLWPDPLQIEDHHVPVLISERVYSRGDHWDLTTQQILPYIDGFSHVAKIAAAADVDNNLVKACVENLLYYEQVRLLPIFQYSNVYVVTSGIRRLYEDPELQEECRRTVSKHCASRPQLCQILEIYCRLVELCFVCGLFSFSFL
ncbi:Nitrogen permease regulator 2-like protein [Portunus trituberculatus]|uniref:Nitrogen permease regulator 2-like protein n=1 Tax=Portunus trituberculatus TaxID=210409 RepID=A0A5B7GFS8_PORTR|nr:Nitrogen permease regulator 2-like protein [Portunus trituberculatus]